MVRPKSSGKGRGSKASQKPNSGPKSASRSAGTASRVRKPATERRSRKRPRAFHPVNTSELHTFSAIQQPGGHVLIKFRRGGGHHRIDRLTAVSAFPILKTSFLRGFPFPQFHLLGQMFLQCLLLDNTDVKSMENESREFIIQRTGQVVNTAFALAYNHPNALRGLPPRNFRFTDIFSATCFEFPRATEDRHIVISSRCAHACVVDYCQRAGLEALAELETEERMAGFQDALPQAMDKALKELKSPPKDCYSNGRDLSSGERRTVFQTSAKMPGVWKRRHALIQDAFVKVCHAISQRKDEDFFLVLDFARQGPKERAALERLEDEDHFSSWRPRYMDVPTDVADGAGGPPAQARTLEAHRMNIIEAHEQILLCAMNQPPSFNEQDVETALRQLLNLVEVGEYQGGHLAVRGQANTLVTNMPSESLFPLIQADPIRAMRIALALENLRIFDEALIHLVGTYGNWSRFPSPPVMLDPSILSIIKRKAGELRRTREAVERDIMLNLTALNEHGRQTNPTEPGELEPWLVTNLVRDWFCNEVRKIEQSNKTQYGQFYRAVFRGGDAFLPWEQFKTTLNQYEGQFGGYSGMFASSRDILRVTKEELRDFVQPLVANHSSLHVDEMKIDYLTCVEIEPGDRPWVLPDQSWGSDDDMISEVTTTGISLMHRYS